MDIIAKAKELGTMIGSSEEMTNYKKFEDLMEQDEKARTLFSDYKLLQVELLNATKENRDKEIVESIKNRLLATHTEIANYEVTKNYLDAKLKFENFSKTINDVMIYAITGEEPCSTKGCGTCSGCK